MRERLYLRMGKPAFRCLLCCAIVGSVLAIAAPAFAEQCELKQDDIKKNSNFVTLYAQLVVNHDDISKADHDNMNGEYEGYGYGTFARQSGSQIRENLEHILGIRLDQAQAEQLLANYVSDNARQAYIFCIEHQSPTPLLAYADPDDQSNRRIRVRWEAVQGQTAQKVLIVFQYKDAKGNLTQDADVGASGGAFTHQIDRPVGRDASVDVWVYKNSLATIFKRKLTGRRYGTVGRIWNTTVHLPVALTTSITLEDASKPASPVTIVAIDEWGQNAQRHQIEPLTISGGEGTVVDINNLKGQDSQYKDEGGGYSCASPSLKFNPSSDYAPSVTVTPSVNPANVVIVPAHVTWVLQPLFKKPVIQKMDFGHAF